MGPFWVRQGPGGPHVGPMNFAIWERLSGDLSYSHIAEWWQSYVNLAECWFLPSECTSRLLYPVLPGLQWHSTLIYTPESNALQPNIDLCEDNPKWGHDCATEYNIQFQCVRDCTTGTLGSRILPRALSLTQISFNPITCAVKCGMKLFIIPKLHRWRLGMDKCFHRIFYIGCNCLSMLGSKLIHVSKGAPVVRSSDSVLMLCLVMLLLRYPCVCFAVHIVKLTLCVRGIHKSPKDSYHKGLVYRMCSGTNEGNIDTIMRMAENGGLFQEVIEPKQTDQ